MVIFRVVLASVAEIYALQTGIAGWIPANRRVFARLQGVHVFLGQLEIKHLRILEDAGVGDRLGEGDVALPWVSTVLYYRPIGIG